MPDTTLALTVAYIGAGYHGFARQAGLPTIQGELEEALATLFRHPVETVGAGRTDAGVHALGQVVSCQLDADELSERSLASLRNSLNALTSDKLNIRAAETKPEGFSARFSAVSREYRYRLAGGEVAPMFLAPYVWWVPGGRYLDVNRMLDAAQHLTGEHDFKSFCVAASSVDKNTVRELQAVNVFAMDHLGEYCTVVQVIGNAFLHSMVRIIVGTLVEVGLHRQEPDWLAEVLAACDRQAAGQTAPPQGLTLWRVRY